MDKGSVSTVGRATNFPNTEPIATVSTIRDSTYVLDEILDNETELPILEHTTDTAGYTELVFALFDLLGLQFSPRIRDLE